jgi:integrase
MPAKRRAAPGQGREYALPSGKVGIQIQLGGQRHHVTGKNATEARRKRDDLVARHRAGLLGSPEARRVTVAAHLAAWLEGKKATVVPSTWARYVLAVGHLVPQVGRARLAELGGPQVRRAYAALTAKGYSPVSVRHAHGVLFQACAQAVADGVLARNPCEGLRGALPKNERREVEALTGEEVARLLATESRWRPLWTLAAYSGLREGELLGLLWRDVDLERGRVTVQRVWAVGPDGKHALRPYPKRHSSVRTVDLPAACLQTLRNHRRAQLEEKVGARYWLDTTGAVFLTAAGARPLPSTVVRDLQQDAKAAGIARHVSPHLLRHTYASHLLAAGRPVTEVARLLGHSNPAVTLKVYAHYIHDDSQQAADALSRAYGSR